MQCKKNYDLYIVNKKQKQKYKQLISCLIQKIF